MFKNDRMMLILTGLVLAVFAGSMVQYGDRIVAMMSGNAVVATQDDSYSVRAGSRQILDVLSNDSVKGPIVVLSRPSCGSVELTGSNRLSFSSTGQCNGEVEFAYCVDADGKCEPNAVKVNVISVNYAQATSPATAATTPAASTQQTATAQNNQVPAPAPDTNAPEIENFAVEMAPPTLAAPSITELVSPSMAVASIRRAAGGLDSASSTDQNIATQNSASITPTATSGPATFSAPEIGGASNISLGGASRVVASAVAAPTSLQTSSSGGSNIVQLERGPEALDSLQIAQSAPTLSDTPPITATPEVNGGAPVFVASAQTTGPSPDAKFSATPIDSGPIALVALSRTPTRGNGAGESLNIVLAEPGLQTFKAPAQSPLALAPTSARPSSVSVLQRGPNVEESLHAPKALTFATGTNISSAPFRDPEVARSPHGAFAQAAVGRPYNAIGMAVVASQPVQAIAPHKFFREDTISRYVSMSQGDTPANHGAEIASLALHGQGLASAPTINLTPANKPQIQQASLTVAPVAPAITAPVQNSACDIAISTSVRSGAMIALEINAACKPNQRVTIEHAGIAFSVLTDAQGKAAVTLPAMQANAEIKVMFEDQTESRTVVAVPNMDSVVRAGVSWQANMNLDLNAIEFGAAIGSEGYVTPASPRDYRSSRVKGGGYLVLLGDKSLDHGALAEVYTMPTIRNQKRGTIAMSIVISDVAPVCGQTISAKTVRSRDGGSAGIRNIRFTVPSCTTIISGPIALPGAIDDIRLAGR